jgi:hypothetical protein
MAVHGAPIESPIRIFAAKLKFSEGELEGSTGTQSDFIIYQSVIAAFNQGTAEPAWEFRPARDPDALPDGPSPGRRRALRGAASPSPPTWSRGIPEISALWTLTINRR